MGQTNQKTDTATTENNLNTESVETPIEKADNEIMPKSRIRKLKEKQSKKVLFATTIGLISIFILIMVYGQSLLINFSLVLEKIQFKDNTSAVDEQDALYIPSPIIDTSSTATNSAEVNISGITSAGAKSQVKLYINDELVDVTDPEINETFIFKNVDLKEGENKIKAITVIGDKKSNYSNIVTIMYLNQPPELTIDEPQDGQSFSGNERTFNVKGKTNPDAKVTVNDFVAIMKTDGSFLYRLPLNDGENKIKVVSIDQAGNKTEKEIKISYSP